MRVAVCDIGSNTIKMKVYDCFADKIVEKHSSVVNAKLISYIKDGVLSAEGIMLLCNTVKTFINLAEKEGAAAFYPFATASLRKTTNCEEIIDTVYAVCNVKIELISGVEEAFLSFSGVKNTMECFPQNSIMLDMGGGSTELIEIKQNKRVNCFSMGFGSLSLYLELNNFSEMKNHAKEQVISHISDIPPTKNAVLVGGTALAINKLYCNYFNIQNEYLMNFDMLSELYKELIKYDDNVLKLLNALVPDRVTTVIPGLAAFMGIFELFGVEEIKVSTNGIREGYVFEKILNNTELQNERTR